MAQWKSLYIRTDLKDTGDYPRQGTLGAISPDVFDWGTKQAPNPGDLSWTEYVGGRTASDEINYLYVRGFSNSAKSVEAAVRLFCAPVQLVLWPTLPGGKGWAQQPLKTATGEATQYVEVGGNAKWFTPKPFELVPSAGQGYSLVGCVATDTVPNPPPTTENIIELGQHLRNHPDTAAFFLQPPPQNPHPDQGWSTAFGYYQGAVAWDMLFSITVLGGRAGDSFHFGSESAAKDGPRPPLAKTWTITGSPMNLDVRSEIPALWDAQLTLDYLPVADGAGVPPDLQVTITAYAVVDDGDPAAEHAVDASEADISAHALQGKRAISVGSLTFKPLAPAGR